MGESKQFIFYVQIDADEY